MNNSQFDKKQIPNLITVFRILLVPIYVIAFFGGFSGENSHGDLTAAGIIFLAAGISDLVDGFLARRNQWITDVGKLLDPLADKLLEVAVILCVAIRIGGPFTVMAAVVIVKEIVMILGAFVLLSKIRFYVSAVWCGKLATFLWYLLICMVHFVPASLENSPSVADLFCVVTIFMMILAFAIYTYKFFLRLKNAKEEASSELQR